MLEEIIVDPSPVDYGDDEPVTKFADNPLLSPKLRKSLERAFYDTHDPKLGGLKQFQKFIDHDTVEYGLLRAGQGDKKAEEMTRRTLTFALKLIDPAWGGMYQYSTDFDWDHAHFEKIMSMQAEPLRLYALAYGQFRDAALSAGGARSFIATSPHSCAALKVRSTRARTQISSKASTPRSTSLWTTRRAESSGFRPSTSIATRVRTVG